MNEHRITTQAILPADLIRYPRSGFEPVSDAGIGGEVRVTWSTPREVERVERLTDDSAMLWFVDADEYGQRFLLVCGWQLDMRRRRERVRRADERA